MKKYAIRSLTNQGFWSRGRIFGRWDEKVILFETESLAFEYGMMQVPGSFEVVSVYKA
jgi:hypothetical protein